MSAISQEALAYSAAALQNGDIQGALLVRNREERHGPSPFDDTTIEVIKLILERTPALLSDCPQDLLAPLRIAAAMMELWGTSNIRQFVTVEGEIDYRLDEEGIAHSLHSHAVFLSRIESMRLAGIKRVKVLGTGDPGDCEACRAVDGRAHNMDDVPELPLAECRCESRNGCRLSVVAVVDLGVLSAEESGLPPIGLRRRVPYQ